LEAVVGGGAGAEDGGVQSLPRAAGAEHEEDGIHADAVRGAWLAAAETMRVDMLGEEALDLHPEIVGDTPGFGALKVVHKSVPGRRQLQNRQIQLYPGGIACRRLSG